MERKQILKESLSNTICVLPWNHLYIDNNGVSTPCCFYNYDRKENGERHQSVNQSATTKNLFSHNKIRLSTEIKKVRADLLAGKKPIGCQTCFKNEPELGTSCRAQMNGQYPQTYLKLKEQELSVDTPYQIETLDLRFGNRCNLGCRMCTASASETLADDLREYLGRNFDESKLQNTDWYKDRDFLESLVNQLPGLKTIYIAGGEPFLIPEAWDFLEMIIQKGIARNITLQYHTNLTLLPERAKSLWNEFKSVELLFSIDGIGKVFEYIRYPAKFSTIENNMVKLDLDYYEYNIDSAAVQMTVQAYNIFEIAPLLHWLQTFTHINHYPILSILDSPHELSFAALPANIRNNAANEIDKLLDELGSTISYEPSKRRTRFIDSLRTIRERLRLPDDELGFNFSLFSEFKDFSRWFDKKRNQSLLEILPMLK